MLSQAFRSWCMCRIERRIGEIKGKVSGMDGRIREKYGRIGEKTEG